MLINLSNHPYAQWSEDQKQAAERFGDCTDLPFPSIDSEGGEAYIVRLAEDYMQKVIQIAKTKRNEKVTVHLMGEMTFVYALLEKLRQAEIRCIASTTQRMGIDLGNGRRDIQFHFVRFRYYY